MSMTTVVLASLASSALVAGALLLVVWLVWARRKPNLLDDIDRRIVALAARVSASGPGVESGIAREIEAMLRSTGNRRIDARQRQVLEWLRDRVEVPEQETESAAASGDHSSARLPASPAVSLVRAQSHVDDLSGDLWDGIPVDDDGEDTQVQVGVLSTALCFDADPDRRANAAIGLGRLRDPSGVPHLITALRNDSAERVRTFSAVALGMIGSREAISPLIDVIQHQIRDRLEVSSKISYGGFQLIRSLQREIDPDPSDWLGQDPLAAQIWALGRIGSPAACAALCERLNDSDPGIRWFAAWALGKIGDEATAPALVGRLDDRSVEVRWIAIWALGRMDTSQAVPNLIGCARDPDASIRRIAVWALGRSGSSLARGAVLDALTDEERGVRQIASWALSRLDSEHKQTA